MPCECTCDCGNDSLADFQIEISFNHLKRTCNRIKYRSKEYYHLLNLVIISPQDLDQDGYYTNWRLRDFFQKMQQYTVTYRRTGYLKNRITKAITAVRVICNYCDGFDHSHYLKAYQKEISNNSSDLIIDAKTENKTETRSINRNPTAEIQIN